MTKLIGDLLTLARHDAEKETIAMELFELGDSVSNILARAQAQAAMRQIHIEMTEDGEVVPVLGNQSILERVLMILIDNAIRYTPQGGRIWIATWTNSEQCGFTVRDTGIGIAYADHDRIFERFYRVGAARTPNRGACGLGLAIARSLVDMHGGTIRVESELGRGASFHVGFPRIDVGESCADVASLP